MTELLKRAYDPAQFKKQGHELVEMLGDYLEKSISGKETPVISYDDPETQFHKWKADLAEGNDQNISSFFKAVIDNSIHVHHKHFMGHQIGPTLPVSALAGLLGHFLNNGMGIYEMGLSGTAIERVVIQSVTKILGWGDKSGGFLTSGGTLANLTGLLCAQKELSNVEGKPDVPMALMVSEEAHYCVARAVQIMGWGPEGLIQIPVNSQFQMRTELLEEYFQQTAAQGRRVIAVVGSACTTSTGTYDNLENIADFCERHGLWMHVDGAHGAPAMFSPSYKYLVKGLERANTFAMDFHKMLMAPALATGLFFKDESKSYQTFSQKAQYLWEKSDTPEWYNLSKRTFECTKNMMGTWVYSILKSFGTQIFDDYITTMFNLGKKFADLIQSRQNLELATLPNSNIVCFRIKMDNMSLEEENRLNSKVRTSIMKKGDFYIVQTTLNKKTYLRTTLTNPFTKPEDLEILLDRVIQFANEFNAHPQPEHG